MKTLKYAGRFLMRSKSYTIINLLGLAFSLACCIVLMRYIHRELTVDSHCIDRNTSSSRCGTSTETFTPEVWSKAGRTRIQPISRKIKS